MQYIYNLPFTPGSMVMSEDVTVISIVLLFIFLAHFQHSSSKVLFVHQTVWF